MVSAAAVLGVERSLTGRRWRARSGDDRLALALAQRLQVPEIVGRVLAGRGVPLEDAETYLNPTLRALLPDPSDLPDMDVAAARIVQAIRQAEPVAVFGDYDVDGATSAALLQRFFRSVGADLRIYIPDRLREGYGPNAPALRRLAADGIRLVVTVDCGTLAHVALAEAADAGLDVVVLDHHLAEPALPKAAAVVNPNRIDRPSPYRQLAAVGVVFLLVVGVNRALRDAGWYRDRPEPDLRRWLDLVALGTICDVVPLTGVNRALVAQGLKVMAGRTNPGLAALADVAGMQDPPGVYHVGFLLGPRVNAGGRVGRSDLGARLLATEDLAEAGTIAAELDRLNRERQAIEEGVLREAQRQAEAATAGPVVLVAGEGWHPGVIGIVASRIKDMTGRPSLVVALDGDRGKGSGRSVPGVDIGAAVTAAHQAGLLIDGGGHPMAAGLTVARDRLAELREFLAGRLGPAVAAQADARSLGLDGALSLRGATADLLDLLGRAGPYGAGNAEPRFAVPAARVVNAAVAGEKHVRFLLASADGARLKAIAFRSLDGPLGPALLAAGQNGAPIHCAGHLRADNWRGERRVQFVVEDAALPGGMPGPQP